jgi:glc operon protein GlcG
MLGDAARPCTVNTAFSTRAARYRAAQGAIRAATKEDRMTLARPLCLGLALLLGASAALAETRPALSIDDAKRVAAAASAEAKRLGAPGFALAIVDDGGHLLYLERLDGTFPAAAAVSTEKARTAAVFRRPTADFESAVNGGRVAFLGNHAATPLQGGLPIRIGGQVVGAIGVSGAASAGQDSELAAAGVAGLAAKEAK